MVPYFVIFILLSLFAFTDIFDVRKKQRIFLYILAGIILIFFAALRYGDQDYIPYQEIFVEAQNWNLDASADIGYSFLNSLVGLIWNDPLAVFFLVAGVSVSVNMKCFAEYSSYAFIALLFYFVHNYLLKETIQIRAGLACAIGLYNIRNLAEGKSKKYWFWQIIAMLIHLGSVMFFITWILKKLNFSYRTWIWILGICFTIGMVYPLGAILKSLPEFRILARVQTYSQWGEYAEAIGILSNLATLKQIFVSIVLLLFYNKLKGEIKYFDILTIMYFSSTCWLMVWNDFAIVGARMATFLSIGEPIFLSGFIVLVTPKSRPWLFYILVIVALVFLLVNVKGKLFPYQFYPFVK